MIFDLYDTMNHELFNNFIEKTEVGGGWSVSKVKGEKHDQRNEILVGQV